jgi:hypothetical protein
MDPEVTKKLAVLILILIICFGACSDLIIGTFLLIGCMIIYDTMIDNQTMSEKMTDTSKISERPTPRQRHLDFLNKDRGKIGHFYVKCGKCGRQGVLDKISDVSKTCHDGCPYVSDNETHGKTEDWREPMSFFNNKYIDTQQISCYNCLLDTETHRMIRNYKDYPYVNGPPGTNSFTH